jgi:sterol desaturase/sphingolipid hydroxylase (fatty acid hydroxylase superfamily)
MTMDEPKTRLLIFLVVFVAVAGWEFVAPWRKPRLGKIVRWPGNWGIYIIDIALVRVLFPLGAVGIALWNEGKGYGLLPALGVPLAFSAPIAFVVLDCAIYWQHRIFHIVPALWRFHRMHHSDTELDVTSGFRFHPVEIALSMLIKAAAILALGAPAIAVLAFEVVLNATSLFNHSNIRLAPTLEPKLRRFLVTPEMHRVHHSVDRAETDSNFSFNFPWWDHIFGSYRASAKAGEEGIVIGVPEFREIEETRIDRLLTQPFR